MRSIDALAFSVLFIFTSCVSSPTPQPETTSTSPSEETTFDKAKSGSTEMTLLGRGGKCLLKYSEPNSANPNVVEVGIVSPCNFIRLGTSDGKAMSYSYLNRKKKITSEIFMVTGGQRSEEYEDSIQPDGCGKELVGIKVVGSTVRVSRPYQDENGRCPTGGLDEVWFATREFEEKAPTRNIDE